MTFFSSCVLLFNVLIFTLLCVKAMLDIHNQSADKDQNGWLMGNFLEKTNRRASNKVLRKFVNSAIYVEKPLNSTTSSEHFSISQNASNESFFETKTKRCTCSVDQKTCPCHLNDSPDCSPIEKRTKQVVSPVISSKVSKNKIKTTQSIENSKVQKDHMFKKRVAKKAEEKSKNCSELKVAAEAKMKEREILLEKERANFKNWLTNKKKIEMEAKKAKEKLLEKKELKELEKEKRQLENQLNFHLWLKKKEEADLEKKINRQIEIIDEVERKEKHLKENEKAFQEWVRNSKNRQKPVPLNQGIISLRSARSVTYVNPNPWNPVAD